MAKNEEIKDSGAMQEFGTGAHRDMSDGNKGDMSLVPLDYASLVLLDDPVLANIHQFMELRDTKFLVNALQCSINTVPVFRYDEILSEMSSKGVEMRVYEDEKEKTRAMFAHMILESSFIFEAGGKKYGRIASVH